jgi:hypothetical protein
MECTGRTIDGYWETCGCPDCDHMEHDRIESAAEAGDLTDDEARMEHDWLDGLG